MEMKSKVGSCSTTSTSRDEGDSNNSGSKDYMDVVVDDCIIMDDEYEGSLPGFRFHPTDQELVSFYLKRKVDKRPLSIQIIKDMDIYKHDPWDLAKSRSVGDKEWYFYCKRGRKYRNSVRPNRVTGSGFWKATGIDRPIYSNGGEGQHCVGLKKSLVYYRGCAGKGTKTDWMMHEFRLPTNLPPPPPPTHHPNSSNPTSLFEAEIWTLCRIFKRNKRQTPDWKELSARKNAVNSSSKPSSVHPNPNHERYISFATQPSTVATNVVYAPITTKAKHDEDDDNDNIVNKVDQKSAYFEDEYHQAQWNNYITHSSSTPASSNSSSLNIAEEYENELGLFGRTNWDDLSSVVEFAVRTPLM